MKTEETKQLEKLLFLYNKFNSFFCIFECTIGFGGGGRVDCISIDTHECIRCFEIKVTKSDFHSKHGHNFVGNLNYYVMPYKLYQQVSDEIPSSIGVLCPYSSQNFTELKIYKRAQKRNTIKSKEKLKVYIIRSLFREYDKYFCSNHNKIYQSNIDELKNKIKSQETKIRNLTKERAKYINMLNVLHENIKEYLGKKYKDFRKFVKNG